MNPWQQFTHSGLMILAVVAIALAGVVGVAYIVTGSDVSMATVHTK